ncbi:MAG: carboxymuconolactone decarboxylase family protein [Eubacteriales bacterium]|nr:carboxymuconolactone decarboxylase family protein [Eubacteriales bacterium]
MENENMLYVTDPEFMERFEHFAFEEVPNEEGQQLEEGTRYMAILATLIGCQGADEYRLVLPGALDAGVTPVAVKEIVYQAVDYLGIGRVLPFLNVTNEIFAGRGIALPLEGQCTTTLDNRLEKGAQAQAEIFGEHMKEAWKAGHINRWLAANCFGDYYTRTGLDLAQREMITFCFLMAQGGCEPQLTAHAAGNMNLGNDKDFLIQVVSQCLPYIGYPRSLNAISCVNQAAEMKK